MLTVSNVTPALLPACHSSWYGRAEGLNEINGQTRQNLCQTGLEGQISNVYFIYFFPTFQRFFTLMTKTKHNVGFFHRSQRKIIMLA